MPDITPNLGLKKPLGNETVSRVAYNENLDLMDANAAKSAALAAHLAETEHIPYAIAAGVANVYTVTLDPVPTAYNEGMAIAVKINLDNTGAATVDINGLGAKTIKKANSNDVSAGNLKAGSIYTLRYNGVNFILQGEGGSGTAVAADVIAGKTFTNDAGESVGTMTNQGQKILTPGTANIAIPAGYHDGTGYVVGDTDLIAANIKDTVGVFGVVGSYDHEATNPITAGDVVAPHVGFVNGAKITGTVIEKIGSATILTPSTVDQAIPAGRYGGVVGDGKVLGDADLVAGNIKSGVNIFGVAGSLIPEQYGKILIYNGVPLVECTNYTLDPSYQRMVTQADFYINQPIDMTNYSYLVFYAEHGATESTYIGISTTTLHDNFVAYAVVPVYAYDPRYYSITLLDISAYNGMYYICSDIYGISIQSMMLVP